MRLYHQLQAGVFILLVSLPLMFAQAVQAHNSEQYSFSDFFNK